MSFNDPWHKVDTCIHWIAMICKRMRRMRIFLWRMMMTMLMILILDDPPIGQWPLAQGGPGWRNLQPACMCTNIDTTVKEASSDQNGWILRDSPINDVDVLTMNFLSEIYVASHARMSCINSLVCSVNKSYVRVTIIISTLYCKIISPLITVITNILVSKQKPSGHLWPSVMACDDRTLFPTKRSTYQGVSPSTGQPTKSSVNLFHWVLGIKNVHLYPIIGTH